MCVDDYQFRHFSATRDKVCRKFVIADEDDFARTYFVNISQFEEYGDVGICKILIYLSTKGLPIRNRKFYLPKFSAIIQPFTFCRIVFEALDQKQILVRSYAIEKSSQDIFAQNQAIEQENDHLQEENYYCRFEEIDNIEEEAQQILNEPTPQYQKYEQNFQPETMEEEQYHSDKIVDENEQRTHDKTDQNNKKNKQAERGISHVILAVKIWRKLYQSKKCNLTKGAKIVGISKKSLDDYYLVLRIGQILGFDFAANLEGKMGDLRNFIRLQESKVTGKLGKNVECFKLVEEVEVAKLLHQFEMRQGFD